MDIMNINDHLSFNEKHEKHGLRGHVQVFRENMETGEISLWEESDNTITISGYQWLLMKCFNLYLDSKHDPSDTSKYEVLGKDSTIIIPDLNSRSSLPIGKPVNSYTPMNGDISADHFIQGFMVGNRGGAEDGITTKNTDYSFVALRNPIPFQQTNDEKLSSDIAGQYLGILNTNVNTNNEGFSKSYYIKRFDERPHIYHSWYKENQKWDYVDPVTVLDLGPNSTTANKTNRIETYIECKLSLSDDDCFAYFSHAGSNETPAINELGLVAFDVDPGARSVVENIYESDIKQLIAFIFDNKRESTILPEILRLASEISDALNNLVVGNETVSITTFNNSNINAFMSTIENLSSETVDTLTDEKIIDYQNELVSTDNIEVEALYNQKQDFIYSTDKFLHYLASSDFDSLTTDEAQRIKLITYYTFNSIPLQKNWRTLINYRIYAN
ncbi:MAG: hypothetical protein IKU29_00290 [Parabacteroides sp.]|nr:hypothetical protein [Parabacteroides sp.]